MNKKRKILGIALIITMLFSFCLSGCVKVGGADTIIYANVITDAKTGERAEAVTIKDGKIDYVGSRQEAKEYAGDDTQIVDKGNDYLMPGFVDGHNHLYVYGENTAADFNLEGRTSVEQYMRIISDGVSKDKKDFYIGCGWEDSYFENGCPTTELLDKISADVPIYIKSLDCHSCWVNSAMMKRCKITKDTVSPIGGVIEKYDNGEPNGCFRDTAMDILIKPYVPVYSVDEYKEMLLKAQEKYLGLGYIAYNDVIIDEQSIDNIVEAYHQLDQEGKLLCYVNVSCIANNSDKIKDDICHYKDLAENSKGTHFAVTDVKFFVDGIFEARTALVKEPYIGEPNNYGCDRWLGEEGTKNLREATALCNNLGLNAHFHAIGDKACEKALDAIQYAKDNSIRSDVRNVITHAESVTKEDIQRMAKLNVIASCNTGWCAVNNGDVVYERTGDDVRGAFVDGEIAAIGLDRYMDFYPYKSLMNAGTICAFATDYPAGDVFSPYEGLQVGITRMYNNVKSSLQKSSERMTAPEALQMITQNGAYQLGHENEFGKIAPGYSASMVLINNDLLTMNPANILKQTKTLSTWIDGKMVFELK